MTFPVRPAIENELVGEVQTIVGILRRRAEQQPSETVFTYLPDQETAAPPSLTFAELYRRAAHLAARLAREGLCGERALLLYPAGLEFIEAFLGCLMAGVIAVPVPPLSGHRSLDRLAGIADDCSARAALATRAILRRFQRSPVAHPALSRLRWIETDHDADEDPADAMEFPPTAALAYLQYTSGSTSAPKGVMVSHANVLANSEDIRRGFAHTPESRSLSWLPHFHDMGLVDGILQPIYSGFPAILMSPASFLQDPARWLQSISRHRVTHSGGPNFAYDLCVRRIEVGPSKWDLSSWSVAYNGAEPVRAETLERFASRFAACGFRRESFHPAYGLAEATLKVSGAARGRGPEVLAVGARALEAGRVEDVAAEGRTLVGCGGAGAGTNVVIADPQRGVPAGEDQVGEIWVTGPGVTLGYWNREEESERIFGARLPGRDERFLRTGDLGFQRNGQIFITGRLKDLIIIRGRNLHPQDIERTAGSAHAALRSGAGAAFGVEARGEERLVLVHEVDRHSSGKSREVLEALRSALLEAHEVAPLAIVLVKTGGVPMTSSGKVRRSDCRAAFLEGALPVLAEWRSTEIGWESAPEAGEPQAPRDWLIRRLAGKLGIAAQDLEGGTSLSGLGLDSLGALELTHAIERRFGVALTPSDLLAAESLSEIVALVEARPSPEREGASDAVMEECPLSAGQKAIWFLQELAPESTAYTIAAALRLSGPLDEEAFAAALRALVARHPSLRARIVSGPDGPMQRFDVAFEAIYAADDRGTPGDWERSAPEEMAARLAEEAYKPFDLASGPLFRVALLRDGDSRRLLLISCHHLIADLWSLSVVYRDLQELYTAALGWEAPPATPAPHPAEFVAWHARRLGSSPGERQLQFWRAELNGDLPALELPTDRPRPPTQTFAGDATTLRLDDDLAAALRRLAREQGVTLYTLLLAAYQVFLHRLTGQTEVLVGSPVSGRTYPRFEGLVAYLVNTAVLRAEFHGDPAFTSHLAATRERVLGALRNQDYPFVTLVKKLAVPRDPSRSPLVDTLFDFHGVGDLVRGDLAAGAGSGWVEFAGGVQAEPVSIERRTAPFDLSTTVTDDGRALRVELEYNTDLFDAGTIDSFAHQLTTLLSGIVAAPGQRVSSLPLLSTAERAAMLRHANAQPPAERADPIHRLFEREAARRPSSVAAFHGSASLTYGELNRRSNALARRLKGLGIRPEARVAVTLAKSLDLLVALLGVLKAGGAYVPIDPSLPAARKRLMVSDSGASVLVTTSRLAGEFPPGLVRVSSEEFAGLAEQFATKDLEEAPAPHNLAYVLYTSGSSGMPKGVAVTHANLFSAHRAWVKAYDLRSLSTHLQMASPSFDVFTGDLVRALCSGGALVLVDRDTLLDPPALAALIRRYRPQFGDFVPAPLRELAAYLTRAGERLDSFKIVPIGADVWSRGDYELFRTVFGEQTRLFNGYGVTEATIDNILDLDDVEESSRRPVPAIGRPIANTAAYVLDASLEPVSVGVPGELCLGGPAVARGYIGRGDLTAERFQPDPHGEPGSRLYRTGDAARLLPDGRIEFIGRRDSQVKIRGYRVEPGEVEAVLALHPAVRECAVVPHPSPTGPRLCAYVVTHQDGEKDVEALRSYLAERLPEYMVPSAVLVMETLPVSLHGKIDRRALPLPDFGKEPAQPHAAAASRAEQVLREIWTRILRVEEVGPDDNFFELGGDSILSIQVVARARDAGLHITPRMLFERPTPAGLAELARRRGVRAAEPPWSGEAPLLPMQAWFFEQRFAEASHWNMALALESRQPLDPEAARRAAAALVEHHDALRARFERTESGWRQAIADPEGPAPELSRVEADAGESREAAVERCVAYLTERLDIESSPLIALGIATDAAGGWTTLVLVAHHLAVDGVSLRILAEDFERAYGQARRGEAIALPPRTAATGQWSQALVAAVGAGRFDGDVAHWRSLASLEAVKLPLGGSDAVPLEETSAYDSVEMDERETEALQHAAREQGERIDDVLLAAFACACGPWLGGGSLLVELEGHGRDLLPEIDVSRTVGWFTQTRPVLIEGIQPDDFSATLEAVRRATSAALAGSLDALRRHASLSEVREVLGRIPAPPISFNYLGRLDAAPDPSDALLGALRVPSSPQRSPRGRRTHALEVDAIVTGGRLRVRWSTSRAQLEKATVRRLADDFHNFLSAFSTRFAPDAGIEEVLPLSPMQEGMLFHHLRDARDPYVSQIALELAGDIHAERLAQAWQLAVDHHPALRAEFAWEGRERPAQMIRRRADLPIRFWKEGEESLEGVMEAARAPGFDFSKAPLARLDLVHTAANRLLCVFTHHHILLDGWSTPLMIDGVFDAYDALVAGASAPQPDASALRRYSAWLAAGDLAEAERFFRAYLAGFASPTPLPAPGEARASAGKCRILHEEGPPDAARRSKALGLTPGTLIQAAWALVLAASSGERDVLFGATSSGRPPSVEGIEGLVGLCINTLPVRARIDFRVEALEWMRSLQQAGAELRQYEYAPLALIQRCAPIPPNAPLFDSVLVFENYPVDLTALGRRKHFAIASVRLHEETNYPLTIVADQEEGLRLRAAYRTSHYDEPAARVVLQRLVSAMEELLSRPEALLGEISVLPEAERRRVLVEWNETQRPYPRQASLIEIFDRAASGRAEETALAYDGGKMTYAELRDSSLRVAAGLRARKVGPESRVALAMERSPALIATMLGVLRCGGAYVPVDPESPPARTRRMLADAGAGLTVSDGRLPMPEGLGDMASSRELMSGAPQAAPFSAPCAESLAYIMFTSGSTGEPKGIEVTHRNVLRLVLGSEYAEMGPRETILQLAPVAFDASTFEIWGALLHGGRLAIAPPGVVSASKIARLLQRHAVTLLWLTAGLFHLMVDEEIAALAGVKQVIAGGDVLHPAQVRRLLDAGCRRVVNGYGPTETTTFACCDVLDASREIGERVPIGHPVANARAYVLDGKMRPVPVGAPGELFIGGDGVARGYAGRMDLTAERFVPDPFGPPGARLYRTGDIVRWRNDGRVEFLGRRDSQVKVRGFRVEPSEVEKTILDETGVRATAVVAHDGESAGLIAYIVWENRPSGDVAALRRALAERLPGYMIPSRFVELDALPLNANGKVDRRGLPAADAAIRPERSVRPMTPVESEVADLWRRILGVGGVGPEDDFFELGGHSLQAARLLAALRRAFRVDLPMTAFYEKATVEAVARALIAHQPEEGHVARAARALVRLRSLTPAQAKGVLEKSRGGVKTP